MVCGRSSLSFTGKFCIVATLVPSTAACINNLPSCSSKSIPLLAPAFIMIMFMILARSDSSFISSEIACDDLVIVATSRYSKCSFGLTDIGSPCMLGTERACSCTTCKKPGYFSFRKFIFPAAPEISNK